MDSFFNIPAPNSFSIVQVPYSTGTGFSTYVGLSCVKVLTNIYFTLSDITVHFMVPYPTFKIENSIKFQPLKINSKEVCVTVR